MRESISGQQTKQHPPQQVTDIVQRLSDKATTHSLLKSNPLDADNEYFAIDRHGPDEFHGIMIDTGAAGKSTAGFNQYAAYGRVFGKTTQEGTVKATFSIGSTTSIGSIIISTRIGECCQLLGIVSFLVFCLRILMSYFACAPSCSTPSYSMLLYSACAYYLQLLYSSFIWHCTGVYIYSSYSTQRFSSSDINNMLFCPPQNLTNANSISWEPTPLSC
jgi:hypothetical protein